MADVDHAAVLRQFALDLESYRQGGASTLRAAADAFTAAVRERDRLREVLNAARAHRATIHMRLHPMAVNHSGELLDAAIDSFDDEAVQAGVEK